MEKEANMCGTILCRMNLWGRCKTVWPLIAAVGVFLLSEWMASLMCSFRGYEWVKSQVRDSLISWGVGVGGVARVQLLMIQITGPIAFALMLFLVGYIWGRRGKRVAVYACVVYPGMALFYDVWVIGRYLGMDVRGAVVLDVQKLVVVVCGALVGYASWCVGKHLRKLVERRGKASGVLAEPREDVSGGGIGGN